MGNQLTKIALTYETQDFQVLTVVHPLYLTPLTNVLQVCILIIYVSFILEPISLDVCWLRLDFESFTLQGVADTQELNGGVCLDSFSVSVCISLKVYPYSLLHL